MNGQAGKTGKTDKRLVDAISSLWYLFPLLLHSYAQNGESLARSVSP